MHAPVSSSTRHGAILAACAALSSFVPVGASASQVDAALPPALLNVGITEKLDAQVPLDLEFTDQDGRTVVLSDYFERDRPVLLSLVYYRCPMLCTLVLDGMTDALREMDWVPGGEFEVVSVSIDPREEPALAREKKANYIEAYGKPEADAGWHFLTGKSKAIETLADSIGFRYRYLKARDEYAHAAALFVLTPDGRVSRYLYGVRHDPKTVRLSLVEASRGKIGSVMDRVLLYCYRYDSEEGRYAPVARNIMRVGGGLTALVLGTTLLTFWRREARQKRLA